MSMCLCFLLIHREGGISGRFAALVVPRNGHVEGFIFSLKCNQSKSLSVFYIVILSVNILLPVIKR